MTDLSCALPGWLQTAAALGDAGLAATFAAAAAVVAWRHQRRRERRSEVADRAIVAVHIFCDELTRLWMDVRALVEASRGPLDTETAESYLRAFESIRHDWRERNRPTLRELEVAHIQARTLLPGDWHWISALLTAYRFAENAMSVHLRTFRSEWLSDDAMKAIEPVLGLNEQVDKIRRATAARLGPIARYEDAGALAEAWRAWKREMDAQFGRDVRPGAAE